jgi:hypothetical protein
MKQSLSQYIDIDSKETNQIYFDPTVSNNHIYIKITPLIRIANKL